MREAFLSLFLSACCILVLASCQTRHEGAVEGTVVPPCPGVRVTVSRAGTTVCTVDANARDGKFKIMLAPGKYNISVSSPASPFPVNFFGIIVGPGKTATLPPLEMVQLSGTAVISGTVSPGGAGAKVTLFSEGAERASVAVAPDGRYEFAELPPGDYTLEASAPGYAGDGAKIRISGDTRAAQNIRLLYISRIDGVDWTRGIIHARGKGLYPANSSNPTAKREMARRAALSEAERNLLRIIDQIKLDPNRDLKSIAATGTFASRIKGYVQGFRVVDEREVYDGVEVELDLPLTGPNGLTRHVFE